MFLSKEPHAKIAKDAKDAKDAKKRFFFASLAPLAIFA